MRTFLAVVFLFVSHQSQATLNLAGAWCQSFDDFTEVLLIDQNQNLQIFAVGNQSGENHAYQTGYLSVGASGAFISVEDQSHSLADVSIRKNFWTGFTRKLTLRFSNGDVDTYKACSVQLRQVEGRPSVTILK